MKQRPTIETERLILRPFILDDAPEVQRLAGEREVAANTLTIPHPYEDGMAEEWISTHQGGFEKGELVNLAITRRSDGALVGAIGLVVQPQHERAELGYWVGKPYWNQGCCTEAARALVGYGFETLGLNRVYSHHFARNPASGRVMQKIGMIHEGRLRHHFKKWGVFEDSEQYGILKSEYQHRSESASSD
jgi:RimJ/RimL family protein N-acetyltransferase